jgi:hypothetical protein
MNGPWYKRSIIPAVQEMPMPTPLRSSASQGELFSPPAKLPQLPPEVQQKMTRLLARMLNEHLLHRLCPIRVEAGDE